MALLALAGWKSETLVMVALACNLMVAGQGAVIFGRNGHLRWKNALPFLIGSVPMAYLGGMFEIDKRVWLTVLGLCLLLSGVALLLPARPEGKDMDEVRRGILFPLGLGIGGLLGFLAGLVGIGGGIFLSPILHILGIGRGREIAALAATFIFLNSASGLAGQVNKAGLPDLMGPAPWLLAAVVLGGNIGSRVGSGRLSFRTLRYWTAAMVGLAGVRILSSL